MEGVSKNLLFFLCVTFILTSLIGSILIITNAPLFVNLATGRVPGMVGLCIGITPVISTIGNQEAFVGVEFYYDVDASAGDENLEFSVNDTSLFTIDSLTGEINFTPNSSQQGNTSVKITATNDICATVLSSFEDVLFEVRSEPPVLDVIGTLNATEEQPFYYDVNASDDTVGDNASLVYSVNVSWFLINSSSGIIDFTPSNDDVGEHIVRFTVTDPSGGQDYEDVNFSVENVNDAPVLDEIPNFTDSNGNPAIEDSEFYYDVNATDVDAGDSLAFTDDFAYFVINEDAGVIQWTPNKDQLGNHTITVYVADGEAVDSQLFRIEVLEVNDAPIMEEIGSQTAYINISYAYDVNATDEEDDPTGSENGSLTYNINDTTLFTINSTNGQFNITASDSQAGNYLFNISVNDTQGLIDSEVISFSVVVFNNAPTIDSYSPVSLYPVIDEGSSQAFEITKSDPDGTIPSVQWYLDKSAQSGETNDAYTYSASYSSSGVHNVTVIITDGELTDAVQWSLTVNDKVPPSPSAGGGGGGGGGGGLGRRCSENWQCTDWGPCQVTGIQMRQCIDLKKCGTEFFKPREIQTCIFSLFPSCFDGIKNQGEILADCGGPCKTCPTCDDGIQNQGETGIDCGGPCVSCFKVEKPRVLPKTVCGNHKLEYYGIKWIILIIGIALVISAIVANLIGFKLLENKNGLLATLGYIVIFVSFIKSEIISCIKDSWSVWILIISFMIISIILLKKRSMIGKGTDIEKERIKKLNVLIRRAYISLSEKNASRLKVTCDRIEVLYNSLKNNNNKKNMYRKIKRLNKKINRFGE